MKKIGLVGGISWRSTVEYYAGICRRTEGRGRDGSQSVPEIVIESLDLRKAASLLGSDGDEASWERFDEYHRKALLRLQGSGAELAAIASNTPHLRFESITSGLTIPVINIFDVTATACAVRGLTSVLILGTRHTMRSETLRRRFAQYGIEVDGPEDDRTIEECLRLIAKLQEGHSDGMSEELERLAVKAYRQRFSGSPSICLSCTELPLAFPKQIQEGAFEAGGVCFLNSTALHIDAVLETVLSEQPLRGHIP